MTGRAFWALSNPLGTIQEFSSTLAHLLLIMLKASLSLTTRHSDNSYALQLPTALPATLWHPAFRFDRS